MKNKQIKTEQEILQSSYSVTIRRGDLIQYKYLNPLGTSIGVARSNIKKGQKVTSHTAVYMGNDRIIEVTVKEVTLNGKSGRRGYIRQSKLYTEGFLGIIPHPEDREVNTTTMVAIDSIGKTFPYRQLAPNCQKFGKYCHGRADFDFDEEGTPGGKGVGPCRAF